MSEILSNINNKLALLQDIQSEMKRIKKFYCNYFIPDKDDKEFIKKNILYNYQQFHLRHIYLKDTYKLIVNTINTKKYNYLSFKDFMKKFSKSYYKLFDYNDFYEDVIELDFKHIDFNNLKKEVTKIYTLIDALLTEYRYFHKIYPNLSYDYDNNDNETNFNNVLQDLIDILNYNPNHLINIYIEKCPSCLKENSKLVNTKQNIYQMTKYNYNKTSNVECEICFEKNNCYQFWTCNHSICKNCKNSIERCPFCRADNLSNLKTNNDNLDIISFLKYLNDFIKYPIENMVFEYTDLSNCAMIYITHNLVCDINNNSKMIDDLYNINKITFKEMLNNIYTNLDIIINDDIKYNKLVENIKLINNIYQYHYFQKIENMGSDNEEEYDSGDEYNSDYEESDYISETEEDSNENNE